MSTDGTLLQTYVESGGADELVIRVVGEIDMSTIQQLESVVLPALDGRASVVQLDLGGVRFFGSEGVRLLERARRTAAESGVTVTVTSVSPVVRRVLEITGTM